MYGQGQSDQGTTPPGNYAQKDQKDDFVSVSGVGTSMKTSSGASPLTPEQLLKSKRPAPLIPILIIAIVIAVGALTFVFFKGSLPGSTTTTTSTAVQSGISPINNCGIIARPGYYFVSQGIKTQIGGGACINVSSSNVNIICNGNRVTGSGPFVIVPPFTYGVSIVNRTNVTISGCRISNFSYGVFVASSNDIHINDNNISINYVSNVYLNATHNSTVSNNYISKSSSPQGSMFLTNGTSGVNVINNTIQYNLYIGINVNSSNNTFIKNFLSDSPFSFGCSVPNGFVTSSKAYSNVCYNSSGCGFVECTGINIPTNVSKLILQSSINTCGSIVSPGTYQLESNLNMNEFVNISNILSLFTPCIRVASKNVLINCNGFSINNSSVAISALNEQNVTIENCKVNNADIGVSLSNVSVSRISNLSVEAATYGIKLYNTSLTSLYNISAETDTYGMYLSSSYSNIFQRINATHNAYGIYLENNSFSNTFDNGAVLNSSKVDVFATPDSANASYNLMISVSCGYTNAVWATCRHFLTPTLAYVPVSSCSTISAPGNYLLTSGIINGFGQCIKINSDNVRFNCANRIISASSSAVGPALIVSNAYNVTINSCYTVGFPSSITVSNSSLIMVNGTNVQASDYGIVFNSVKYGTVTNSTINGTSNTSIMLYNTVLSDVFKNEITYGKSKNIGILLNNSQNNTIMNNSGSRDYIGVEFMGSSHNNTVVNNTMQLSTYLDYMCAGNSALTSENGGINYGTTKSGCHWLAALTVTNPTVSCAVALQPNLFLLTQDYKYTVGSTCFSSFANTTTINCNGHTVIATNGGTFADFKSSDRSTLENCFLKGFTNTIIASNSSIDIFNNSIYENKGSQHSIAISVSDSKFGATVQADNVSTQYTGISLSSIGGGTMQNNNVESAIIAYMLYNVSGMSIRNNTAYISTYNGIVLNNSVTNIFQNNNFSSSSVGISCLYKSQGSTNNTDLGGNRCTLNKNCLWAGSSSQICP